MKKNAPAAKEEKRQSTIYFPVSLLKRAKKFAIDEDRDLSDLVVDAVRLYLDSRNAPE